MDVVYRQAGRVRPFLELIETSIQWVAYLIFFPGVKRPERDFDRSPPCSVEVRNE
jgi:hypothetical protein